MKIHPDFDAFITTLNDNRVEFVIVGAYALAFHGQPRATGDIDIWIRPKEQNAENFLKALKDFGFGKIDIKKDDVLSGKIVQLGYPPVRIDIITIMDGLTDDEIWKSKKDGDFGRHKVFFLGKKAFIKNKLAVGRLKDLADVEMLGKKISITRPTKLTR